MSLTAIFASLYVVVLVSLPYYQFGPVQLRIADCLLPLAALFGWPIVWGATVGCLIGNTLGGAMAFGTINPIDVVFGSVANLLATFAIFVFRKRRLLACTLASLIIGIIVGGYLWLFIPPPDILGLPMPAWTAMILSITVSSLIAVAVLGYILLSTLSRPGITEAMKARGLTVYA